MRGQRCDAAGLLGRYQWTGELVLETTSDCAYLACLSPSHHLEACTLSREIEQMSPGLIGDCSLTPILVGMICSPIHHTILEKARSQASRRELVRFLRAGPVGGGRAGGGAAGGAGRARGPGPGP